MHRISSRQLTRKQDQANNPKIVQVKEREKRCSAEDTRPEDVLMMFEVHWGK